MDDGEPKTKAMRAPITKPITQAPVSKAPEPAAVPYEKREWKGRTLWQCTRCPFNSLDERAFWSHWMMRHQPPRSTLSALVGPDGKPLVNKQEE